ncbi:hypothetical protein MG293_001787 [Ovis ammon polii]|uniref:Uncharacterized protein n=1 Tax=Ovis ammon polii TaxID=230172 RepID=A0AAD4UQP7_OVIAM|nr:hypothetical protein MG293_001787 [Ovis ammon polii]
MSSKKHHSGAIGIGRLLSSTLDKPSPILYLPFLSYKGSVWDSHLLHVLQLHVRLAFLMLCVFSVESDSLMPWTAASQTPLSIAFPWQEYRSGLPFPPPGNLPDPVFKPTSPALQVDSLPLSHWGNQFLMLVSLIQIYHCLYIQNLRLVTGGLEIFLHKLYLEKSLMFRICLALPGGSGEENGYPRQYSSLENPMDRRTRQATIHGVAKSWTRLSDYHYQVAWAFQVAQWVKNPYAVQAMIPRLGKSPGGGHGNPLQYSCLENPRGQRILVCYSPWGCKELNVTEATEHARMLQVDQREKH